MNYKDDRGHLSLSPSNHRMYNNSPMGDRFVDAASSSFGTVGEGVEDEASGTMSS